MTAALALLLLSACNTPAVLTQLIDARHDAAALRAAFFEADAASNRAVLSNTDDDSAQAAREARDATKSAEAALARLEPRLNALGYKSELESLGRFKKLFDEYRQLNADILGLAVENTNLKAQRLSFGAGREAAAQFFTALSAAAGQTPSDAVAAQVNAARAAILDIEAVQARHIAEREDATMTSLEAEIAKDVAEARMRVTRLRQLLPPAGQALDEASAALDRFEAVNREVITLSRRNTNLRSLELTMGRKRVVAAACKDELVIIETELAGHGSQATR